MTVARAKPPTPKPASATRRVTADGMRVDSSFKARGPSVHQAGAELTSDVLSSTGWRWWTFLLYATNSLCQMNRLALSKCVDDDRTSETGRKFGPGITHPNPEDVAFLTALQQGGAEAGCSHVCSRRPQPSRFSRNSMANPVSWLATATPPRARLSASGPRSWRP